MAKKCPEKGSTAAHCWSIISNAYDGRISNEVMLEALSRRGINSASDIANLFGENMGALISIAKYVYLTELREHQFGVTPDELVSYISSIDEKKVNVSKSVIISGFEYMSSQNVSWLVGEILGRRYSGHKRIPSLLGDTTSNVVRVLLEGQELGATRVGIYLTIARGDRTPPAIITRSAAVVYQDGALCLANDDRLDMVAAMQIYRSIELQGAWASWKREGFWQPFR